MNFLYALKTKKILRRNLRSILISFGILCVLKLVLLKHIAAILEPYISSDGVISTVIFVLFAVATIIFFPFILGLAFFLSNWILEITDVLLFWVKKIDTEAKTIDDRFKYEDFYLIDYKYSITERHKNSVWALLILTADKGAKFKILCEAASLADAPEECRQFIKFCQENERYIAQKTKRFPARNKIIIGKKQYANRSFYQRIFMRYVVWTVLYLAVLLLELSFVIPEIIFKK